MKTANVISRIIRPLAAVALLMAAGHMEALAQGRNKNTGDTVTYVLYKDTVSFAGKKTVVYNDKQSVDSLASAIANGNATRGRVVYDKYGQKPRVVKMRELKMLDRSGFFRITVAYNKETPTADATPLYMISGK